MAFRCGALKSHFSRSAARLRSRAAASRATMMARLSLPWQRLACRDGHAPLDSKESHYGLEGIFDQASALGEVEGQRYQRAIEAVMEGVATDPIPLGPEVLPPP